MNSLLESMVTPFKTSEVTASVKINVARLIEKQELGLEILEAIKWYENVRIPSTIKSINGFGGTFPELRKKHVHNIEIYNMCINRLYKRYKATINN